MIFFPYAAFYISFLFSLLVLLGMRQCINTFDFEKMQPKAISGRYLLPDEILGGVEVAVSQHNVYKRSGKEGEKSCACS